MMMFPLDDGGALVIIEPGNIRRLKEGKPLKIGDRILVAFTPDMHALRAKLGLDPKGPPPGQRDIHAVALMPEQIDAAVKATLHMPEVEE